MNQSKQSAEAIEMLREMLEDMTLQEEIFQPTQFWRVASESILSELEANGFDSFRRLSSCRSFFVPSYGPPGNTLSDEDVSSLSEAMLARVSDQSKTYRTLMESLDGTAWATADYRVYLAGDRTEFAPQLQHVTETDRGNPNDQLLIEGRRFSRSMLNYLHGLVFLKSQLGEVGIRTILEIGGGYGTLGEILSQAGDEYAYVDVDIPPTSAVASYYLSGIVNELIDYRQVRGKTSIPIPSAKQQMVICPWQLPCLTGEIDLLWNFISFQEMEPHVVQFYLDQGRRLEARFVLLRNLREGKEKKRPDSPVGVENPTTAGDYDAFLPDYDLVATNVFPFGFRTVDGFHSELRLYKRK